MKSLRFLACSSCSSPSLLVAAGCGGGSQSVPSDAVAVVNGDVDHEGAVQRAHARHREELVQGAQDRRSRRPARPRTRRCQDQSDAYLVQQSTSSTQKGKDLGVTVTDKDVQTRLDQIKKQYFSGDETKYQAQLKAQGLTEPQLLIKLRWRRSSPSSKLYAKVTTAREGHRRRQVTAYYNDAQVDVHARRERATCATSSSTTRRSPTSSRRS